MACAPRMGVPFWPCDVWRPITPKAMRKGTLGDANPGCQDLRDDKFLPNLLLTRTGAESVPSVAHAKHRQCKGLSAVPALSWRFFGTKTTGADCAGHKLRQIFALEWVESFARGIRVLIGKIFLLVSEEGGCECDFLYFPPGHSSGSG